MEGRYATNSATTPRPNAASRNARALVGTSRGRTNPSVKSDEPLSTKAVRQLETPRAWNIIVNPPRIIASQTTGSSRSDNGAYSAKTRSRPSYVLRRPAIRSKTRRVISQITLVSATTDPLGRTNDRTAASITTKTSATPPANHRIVTAISTRVSPPVRVAFAAGA